MDSTQDTPKQILQYWRAVDRTQLVHAGFAGWPINQGLIAIPLAKLRGKFTVANVGSSFWESV